MICVENEKSVDDGRGVAMKFAEALPSVADDSDASLRETIPGYSTPERDWYWYNEKGLQRDK